MTKCCEINPGCWQSMAADKCRLNKEEPFQADAIMQSHVFEMEVISNWGNIELSKAI